MSLVAIGMAEVVDGVGRHRKRCFIGRMITVAFFEGLSVVGRMPMTGIRLFGRHRSLMHRHAHSHVCRHGVASPAAQRQQDHHESEHKQTHTLNDKACQRNPLMWMPDLTLPKCFSYALQAVASVRMIGIS